MSRYVLRRLALILPLLLGITIINFTIFALAPGDPATALIDPELMIQMSPDEIQARREALGLNQPIPVRYVLWLGQLVQGNLGYSYVLTLPVSQLILDGIGNTIALIALAMVIETVGGVLLGIISALRRHTLLDYVLTTLAFAGTAMPGFFFALLLIYVVSLRLGMLPTGGIFTPGAPSSIFDRLEHMILPAIALSIDGFGGLLRHTRSSLLEVMDQEYIYTARAKGLGERIVILRHAFRNALLPLITVMGLRLPSLLAGAVLIETVFNYPGIGLTMVRATTTRDYPLLMGGVLVSATAVLLANLLADLAYAWVDPRIRYA